MLHRSHPKIPKQSIIPIALITLFISTTAQAKEDPATSLVIDEHWQLVASQCTVCHSGRLVSQNRMNRQGWQATIKWMQKKHNLWALGENESLILDYLEKHYNITEKAGVRRKNLVHHL